MYFHTLESLLLGIFVGYLFSYIVLNKLLKSYKYNFILNLENLKKYSGEGMLTSVYVYVVSLSICAILMMVIKERTHEMDL